MMLGQLVIVSVLNFRNLRHRFWESLVIVIGMACVSGVLLSMLSMTEGLLDAYHRNVDPRTVIVVARAAVWENASSIPRDQARIVMSAPGIATASDGQPVADAGVIAWVPAPVQKEWGDHNHPAAHVRAQGRNAEAELSYRGRTHVPARRA